MTLLELAERCEQGSGRSRDCDAEIARARGWYQEWIGQVNCWHDPRGEIRGAPPRYTESIDAAALLVPEGMIWLISSNDDSAKPFYAAVEQALNTWDAAGASPALALCAAALGAIAASADTHPKDGDVEQAPLVSGAVGTAETPTPRHPGASNAG